ncbi:hypothetical protein MEO93_21540 [Dolichospermum sp. ST_sed3]|nr:hypothetical protein [Dolichospermum sp. ST_sed3]
MEAIRPYGSNTPLRKQYAPIEPRRSEGHEGRRKSWAIIPRIYAVIFS